MKEIAYIDDARGLGRLCGHLAQQTVIALDTEFIRKKTYYPKPCLLQLATRERVFLIDLIAVADCGELCQLVAQAKISKVMHSCEQDLEVLRQLCGRDIGEVFDTQLAAAFLAHGYQISYENLVARRLNTRIGNKQTLSDWARRPLSQKQKDYAVADVIHLLPLRDSLSEELKQNDKYHWFLDEGGEQIKSWRRRYPNHDSSPLSFLKKAKQWREAKAMEINRPRQWLVSDACLREINQRRVDKKEAILKLAKCRRLRGEYAGILAQLMGEQKGDGSGAAARQKKTARLTNQEINCSKKIIGMVDEAARRHRIEATLIANRKKIIRCVRERSGAALRRAWRHEVLTGDEQQRIDAWLDALDGPNQGAVDAMDP